MSMESNKYHEKEKVKTASFKLNYPNYKSKSKLFGEMELKRISIGDLQSFIKLLDKVKDDREFTVKVLHHQIILPKISVFEFSRIPDSELIKIAKDFVRHEQNIFKYFKETTEEEFFTNFKEAIITYHRKLSMDLQANLEPMIESTKQIFENFNKQYTDFLTSTTYFAESIKGISKITEQIRKQHSQILESLKPVVEQYQSIAWILSETLIPQINFWQRWVEQNRAIFNSYKTFWHAFQEKYKIAKEKAIQVLRKYKWFVSPSMPLSFVFEIVKVGRRNGNQRGAINRLFIEYFTSNNFENLEILVNSWKTNSLFKPRMKIFRDCIAVMKNANNKYNPSNIVLPVLIAQIDGIRIEFMDRNGLSFWNKKWKEWFKGQTQGQELLDLANDIFINILFQNSQPGKPLKTPFTFNRHKIMHGEILRYGRIDNVIRAFLILDFLATITT